MAKRWTKQEETFLRKNIGKLSYKKISEKLGKSYDAITSKVDLLGINKYEIWNSDDEQELKRLYLEDKLSVQEISETMKRSKGNINSKVLAMGIKRKNIKCWSDEEKQFLIDNAEKMTYLQLSEEIDRSVKSVSTMAFRLGIEKATCHWTKEEIEKLRLEYPTKDSALIAKELGKSKAVINNKAVYLGLKKENWYWTKKMENILKKYYPNDNVSVEYIANRVGKTIDEVYRKANTMNILRAAPSIPWTTKQVDYVVKNYPTMSTIRIGIELNKSIENVQRIARMYGVKKQKKVVVPKIRIVKRRLWTKEEDSFIINNAPNIHFKSMAHLLNRPATSLEKRMKTLGVYKGRRKIYQKNGDISFFYNHDCEIEEKIGYCRFWQKELDKNLGRLGGFTYGNFNRFKKADRTA